MHSGMAGHRGCDRPRQICSSRIQSQRLPVMALAPQFPWMLFAFVAFKCFRTGKLDSKVSGIL